jgi:hypothetical protein
MWRIASHTSMIWLMARLSEFYLEGHHKRERERKKEHWITRYESCADLLIETNEIFSARSSIVKRKRWRTFHSNRSRAFWVPWIIGFWKKICETFSMPLHWPWIRVIWMEMNEVWTIDFNWVIELNFTRRFWSRYHRNVAKAVWWQHLSERNPTGIVRSLVIIS